VDNTVINKAIAEQVFGYTVSPQFNDCIYVNKEWSVIPDYSTDIAAAFTVVKRMRDLGYESVYENRIGNDDHIWCFMTDPLGSHSRTISESVPLAICLAALAAVK